MYKYIKTLFSVKYLTLTYIALVIGLSFLWWNATNIGIMFGNYGSIHTYIDITLSIIIILLFPLFLISVGYKSWRHGKRTDINGKTFFGVIGGSIGIIISGASCCGATLAASFGLLPLMILLPYNGLELKIAGTLGLCYALHDTFKYLETCKTKK